LVYFVQFDKKVVGVFVCVFVRRFIWSTNLEQCIDVYFSKVANTLESVSSFKEYDYFNGHLKSSFKWVSVEEGHKVVKKVVIFFNILGQEIIVLESRTNTTKVQTRVR
jgi:hypothetical protein